MDANCEPDTQTEFNQEKTDMKKLLSGLLLLFFFMAAGCSSSPSTPQDQLATISKMLSKGYEMTTEQRQEIDGQVNQANELIKAGKTEEAQKLLSNVLGDLEVIAETDRFNKSE